jgi:hypothetical protein
MVIYWGKYSFLREKFTPSGSIYSLGGGGGILSVRECSLFAEKFEFLGWEIFFLWGNIPSLGEILISFGEIFLHYRQY